MVSLQAVERALDWYADEVGRAERPPISPSQTAALRAVMRGEQPLSPGQIEVLVTFAHTMFLVGQKAPEVPGCVLGDALTALSALGTNASGPPESARALPQAQGPRAESLSRVPCPPSSPDVTVAVT